MLCRGSVGLPAWLKHVYIYHNLYSHLAAAELNTNQYEVVSSSVSMKQRNIVYVAPKLVISNSGGGVCIFARNLPKAQVSCLGGRHVRLP